MDCKHLFPVGSSVPRGKFKMELVQIIEKTSRTERIIWGLFDMAIIVLDRRDRLLPTDLETFYGAVKDRIQFEP